MNWPEERFLPAWLAKRAVESLIKEVNLTPKPALVDRRGSGAHHDLTLALMEKSAVCLTSMFQEMAEVAVSHRKVSVRLREEIGAIGRQGEQTMLQVTGGVNTHKGAIWALGLLVSASVLSFLKCKTVKDVENESDRICLLAGEIACIEDRFSAEMKTHGIIVKNRYGVGGAKMQAQKGFPVVRNQGLRQLRKSRTRYSVIGNSQDIDIEDKARIDALLAMMTELDDSCVLYRSGLTGLRCVQNGARRILDSGGIGSVSGRKKFEKWERELLDLRASAGGSADLLAAVLFLDGFDEPDWRGNIINA